MANSLLDFVMSLVRDPAAAASYAADPAQAIADANLTDVSSVDVDNLIPMVSDSLSMAASSPVPDLSAHPVNVDQVSNVWASGAATSAFDAFGDQSPGIDDGGGIGPVISDPLDRPGDLSGLDVLQDAGITTEPTWDELPVQVPAPDVPDFDVAPIATDDVGTDWGQLPADHQAGPDDPGFDLFT